MKAITSYKFSGKIIGLIFLLITFISCDPNKIDDNNDSNLPEDVLEINKWIDEVMNEVYLWNNKIPSLNYNTEEDSKAFFEKMIYTEEDRWSWITDDWDSYLKELEGTPVSMGYAPAFFYKDDVSDDVIIIIKYVYKNSPADLAGLERGDIILTIDGQTLNVDNYYDLYSGSSYTVGLGMYSEEEKTIIPSGESISITEDDVDANPIQHYEIKEIEGKKIAYLVYTDFTSGVNDAYLDSLDKVIDYFKAETVTDVIIDLRYNPGGDSDAAGHLASALAPKSVVDNERTLIKMIYNNNVQDYFERQVDDSNLIYRFPENNSNLNLNKVYFLTTDGTASASELVITGLEPYMTVVMVGDTTHGKYTGAWVLPDTNDPPKHNWCMVPIVMKYANANNFTNFKDGIVPDIYVHDYLLPARPFGDLNDGVLAAAIEQITGVPLAETTTKSARIIPHLRELEPKEMDIRKTLIVPQQKFKGY